MSDPIRHHINPEFYLKMWATSTEDNKIQRFYAVKNKIITTRNIPANTCYEDYLYGLENVADDKKQIIEKYFMSPEVDDKAAPVFKQLLESKLGGLSSEEKADWIRFIISLRLRTPKIIKYLTETGKFLIKQGLTLEQEAYYLNSMEMAFPNLNIAENFGKLILPLLISNEHIFLENARQTHETIKKCTGQYEHSKNKTTTY